MGGSIVVQTVAYFPSSGWLEPPVARQSQIADLTVCTLK